MDTSVDTLCHEALVNVQKTRKLNKTLLLYWGKQQEFHKELLQTAAKAPGLQSRPVQETKQALQTNFLNLKDMSLTKINQRIRQIEDVEQKLLSQSSHKQHFLL